MTDSPEREEPQEDSPRELTEEEKLLLIGQGLVLQQFLQFEKFRTYVNMNYDLVKDPTTKLMHVIEVPDDEAAKRAMEIMKAAAQNAPKVQAASTMEAKKLLNDPAFLRKAKTAKKR